MSEWAALLQGAARLVSAFAAIVVALLAARGAQPQRGRRRLIVALLLSVWPWYLPVPGVAMVPLVWALGPEGPRDVPQRLYLAGVVVLTVLAALVWRAPRLVQEVWTRRAVVALVVVVNALLVLQLTGRAG